MKKRKLLLSKKTQKKGLTIFSIFSFITFIGQIVTYLPKAFFKSVIFAVRRLFSALLYLLHLTIGLIKKLSTNVKRILSSVFLFIKKSIAKIVYGTASSLAFIKKILPVKYVTIILLGVIVAFTVFRMSTHLPNPHEINDFALPSAILIYDRNNILLYSAYNDTFRIPIKLVEVPQTLVDATVSAEDKRFYSHHGFDFLAMTRALLHNLHGSGLQGGSTITQQLAKNLYLTGERTFARKINEAVIATRIEMNLNKNEILELYFNTTPYGGTAVGIEAAAQKYFGKKTKDLSAKESVFLASLPVGPTMLLEKDTTQGIQERMKYVIDRMIKDKKLTSSQGTTILKEKLHVLPQITYKRAPHAVDYVLSRLEKEYPKEVHSGKGLIVHTSIDLRLQNYIQEKMIEYMSLYKGNHITNGAVLVALPKTGEILSMVGSMNYYDENYGQFNVVTSKRSLGSAMKLITYAYALEHGYTPQTIVKDEPTRFNEYPEYKPKNYDNKFHGSMTMREAFANSYNIPALKVAYASGLEDIANLGAELGVPELKEKKPLPLSMVIGGVEVSLEHLTQAYAVTANDGVLVSMTPFLKITDHYGHTIFTAQQNKSQRVLSEKTANEIFGILSDTNARRAMFGYSPQFNFGPEKIAIKTGTSNDNKDNTAFAFSDKMVVGTWVGNNDNSPMWNVASGYVGSSSIMHDVTQKVLDDLSAQNSLALQDTISKEVNNK